MSVKKYVELLHGPSCNPQVQYCKVDRMGETQKPPVLCYSDLGVFPLYLKMVILNVSRVVTSD